MMDGSRKCFQALWISESIDLFWDATLKEVILIAHEAVLHHSLLVIYCSKYLRASLSNNISALIWLLFCPAALYVFWVRSPSGSKALEEIGSISWSEMPVPKPQTSIFQLKQEADVTCVAAFACFCGTEGAGECVHSQVVASFSSEVHRVSAWNCG